MVNPGDDNEDPAYPRGFTPTNTQAQPNVYPQRVSVNIRPQYQTGTSTPISFSTGSGSNPADNPANPVVPDLDDMAEIEKTRVELPKQLEDRCRWLEEKFRAMENADYHCRIDAKDLSLNMEKKQNESFKQYAQRWREVSTQVHPPLLEKETTMLFINTLKAPFINHMFGSATKSFSNIVMSGEMIENMVRSGEKSRKTRNYCEFYDEEGHEIQRCSEFKALVQGLMDNMEVEFFEYLGGSEREYLCASEEKSTEKVYRANHPVKKEKLTRLELPVNELVTEKEAKEFFKFLKHNEYSVVEQLHKQSAHISVLVLLLSLETHRDTLMKVLNETYVANDISINKLDRLVNNISADNFIFFNDDEIPLGGMRSTKALHITTRCNGYTLPGVLIDNGYALNVLPLSTLNRLPIDSSHMKTCQNIVREFDGTERRVMERIEIPLLIGSNTNKIPMPKISQATRIGSRLTVWKEALPGRGLGRYLQGRVEAPILKDKRDRFGLEFKLDVRQRKKEMEKKQERRRA
ncbi:hypothetical protein EPI10_028612 [Gossypium australe]|uniref:Gag-pro-like protein n=1 Tax=Gossypium australe TaxID=47621 RepID=A0A5B6UVJ1_9ROSI|nr:hypothetical protein EPI10_028612 [Gossypium australe]